MKQTIKTILGLVAIFLVSWLVSQQSQQVDKAAPRLMQTTTYTTTSTRSQNVNDLCPSNMNRASLVSASDAFKAQSQRTEVNAALGIDGYLSG